MLFGFGSRKTKRLQNLVVSQRATDEAQENTKSVGKAQGNENTTDHGGNNYPPQNGCRPLSCVRE